MIAALYAPPPPAEIGLPALTTYETHGSPALRAYRAARQNFGRETAAAFAGVSLRFAELTDVDEHFEAAPTPKGKSNGN